MTQEAKHNLIFGQMASADFYPEGRPNDIDVIVAAPKNTRIWPGKVVIVDQDVYSLLVKALQNIALLPTAQPFDYIKDHEFCINLLHTAQKIAKEALARTEEIARQE